MQQHILSVQAAWFYAVTYILYIEFTSNLKTDLRMQQKPFSGSFLVNGSSQIITTAHLLSNTHLSNYFRHATILWQGGSLIECYHSCNEKAYIELVGWLIVRNSGKDWKVLIKSYVTSWSPVHRNAPGNQEASRIIYIHVYCGTLLSLEVISAVLNWII